MTKKFKYQILGRFIKDLSSETPDVETYLFVRDNISSYQLGIDITSKAIKNKLIEINTKVKFEDKSQNKKKSYFEIVYATVIKVNDDVKDKKELQKIILCDAQIAIYPDLEKAILDLLENSGYPGVKFEKKIDFADLYEKNLIKKNFFLNYYSNTFYVSLIHS